MLSCDEPLLWSAELSMTAQLMSSAKCNKSSPAQVTALFSYSGKLSENQLQPNVGEGAEEAF